MQQTEVKVHRDVPPTRMWCYRDLSAGNAGGFNPVIAARSGVPLQVEWLNQLPTQHFLPVDFSLHGCGRDLPEVRACVHLHGGRTPTTDDGYPEDWFVPGQSRICRYPLQQESATLWYHDHAMGLNRLNIYAGLFGMAIVRDSAEDSLHLPSGRYELPLILFDRNFTADGQLFYPDSGDPEHPWVPEFSGDAILINGKIRPYIEVEPRLYRLRILNGANSRFFALSFSGSQPFHQIASDQGLLAAPVKLTSLSLAPAERADLLIDFSSAAGQHMHLVNGALEILQFRVAQNSTPQPSPPTNPPATLRPLARISESSASLTRTITLNEYVDRIGNSMLMLLNHKHWHEPVTETPKLGATEIWEFVNLTEDTHPMHLHLVRFQVLDRRLFDVFAYRNDKGLRYLAAATQPAPNESGWKDTVQCPPGMITRIIVRFDGYAGKYLYHCHILEHEANDMMRPFEVLPS
jgi:spore coat protein A